MRAWRTLQANSRDSEEQKVQLNPSCPLTVSFLKGGNKTPWPNLWHRSLGKKFMTSRYIICVSALDVWVVNDHTHIYHSSSLSVLPCYNHIATIATIILSITNILSTLVKPNIGEIFSTKCQHQKIRETIVSVKKVRILMRKKCPRFFAFEMDRQGLKSEAKKCIHTPLQ